MNPPNQNPTPPDSVSRRQFLKTSSLAVAGGVAVASVPAILHGQEKAAINAVIVGLGGRGGGAGKNFLEAAKDVGVDGKIVAIADIFPDAARRGQSEFGVSEDNCFSGFDAYVKAINQPGVNYVIIATPPGFKASQFKACVEAGKNVFIEKPVATDGVGCRVMYAASELARQKGLKVAAGTQRRHQLGYTETIKRIQDGAIGDVVFMRAYWVNGGPIWHRGMRGDTDLERQIHNWYHYIWLSGDHICEQHVHNLDVCNWVMNDHPIRCWGQGSRQQLGDKPGEIWDNFDVEYEYPNGVRLYSYCGQIKREWSSVSEGIHGTNGYSRPDSLIQSRHGKTLYRFRERARDPYVQEHVDLINAILKDADLNEGKQVTDSTLTAIMGREAGYSGRGVEWNDILNSKFAYGPELAYEQSARMSFGAFRTLKPPMPSLHDILKDPPMVQES
jgi:myo-inositol 2-dehydrogenase/D-chiro-inositol 1-dehydrogenase